MLICTHEEVEQITGKTKYKAQLRALREMGIPHMARSADGSPVVAVAVVEAMLGVKVASRGTPAPQLRTPTALRGRIHNEAAQKG